MEPFSSADDLISALGDTAQGSFYGVTKLNDTKVGISVKKQYPSIIRYKPPIRKDNGEPDTIAVMWIVYLSPKEAETDIDLRKVPVRIRISLMSQYLASHYDYDFSDVAGGVPSIESLEASRHTPQPIELSFENDFFFNHEKGCFIDKGGQAISGVDLLERVFETHCNTVHLLKGLALRVKLAWQARTIGGLSILIQILVFLLKHLFGRTLDSKDTFAGLYQPYKREALKKLDEDTIEIFGYRASKKIIILFCLLVVFWGIYRYSTDESGGYLNWLAGQEFLSLAHGVLAIWVIDVLIPWGVFILINSLLRAKAWLIFRRFKV